MDNEIFDVITKELDRQTYNIELIASENYVSDSVLRAQGSILTNKYAEGYPDKRYYGGCEFVDIVEKIAIERLKSLYSVDFANVQPHSGSQANTAVYSAFMDPGDVILGLSLDKGGHLTHGSPVNFSGKIYKSFFYGLDDNELINYEEIDSLASKHKPKIIVAGASAYSRAIDWKKISETCKKNNCLFVADIAHYTGLIAAGLYPSPVNYADIITGTTHKTLRGPRGGFILTNNQEFSKKINSSVFPGNQGGPLMHVIAAKAVAFGEALHPSFKIYQKNVLQNAKIFSDVLNNSPLRIVSGGTDSHLILVDLKDSPYNGKEAEKMLEKASITVNKNTIPNDPESPFVTSGIRIGTAAITTRGFSISDIQSIAEFIKEILISKQSNDDQYLSDISKKIKAISSKYPLFDNSNSMKNEKVVA